ncbi:hypothetical protein ABTG34_19385, partial [Acinetobacter baumannii]
AAGVITKKTLFHLLRVVPVVEVVAVVMMTTKMMTEAVQVVEAVVAAVVMKIGRASWGDGVCLKAWLSRGSPYQ